MTDPFQTLHDEHRVIEKVLAALDAAASRKLPDEFYEATVDFIVHFADGCHHAKEEQRLFPVLEEHGIPRDGGPIGCMLEEHEIGRKQVAEMRQCLALGDADGVRRASLEYVTLLRPHIQKEDFVLFPMGQRALDADDVEALRLRFAAVDRSGDLRRRYARLADELLQRATAAA